MESYFYHLLRSPIFWIGTLFQIWMLIDAVRQQEWMWVIIILVFPGIGPIWYFFYVYRGSGGAMRGFELPGAHSRQRIKELQAQIHHLDKPHHHSQLADIYLQQGKLKEAEASYRAAIERDPQDEDTRSHFGQCLLRQNRFEEALPLLEGVCNANPKHDYGHTLMAFAEALRALGQKERAIAVFEQVTDSHSYGRARVQLAELYLEAGRAEEARQQIEEVLADAGHAPAFQRRRERTWVRRAKSLRPRVAKPPVVSAKQ
ncbi:MAG TPA: tetratricopeptide repeat protein [Candidatus Binatia bacterium]|nr:tetratricopeptide repeat protein [Candidatus Binatia bacterium]